MIRTRLAVTVIPPLRAPVRFPVELTWTRADAAAVRLVFSADKQWMLARAALADAVAGTPGSDAVCDVQIAPAAGLNGTPQVMVVLYPHDPGERTVVYLEAGQAGRFLDATFAVVPMGREFDTTDWDKEMEELIQ